MSFICLPGRADSIRWSTFERVMQGLIACFAIPWSKLIFLRSFKVFMHTATEISLSFASHDDILAQGQVFLPPLICFFLCLIIDRACNIAQIPHLLLPNSFCKQSCFLAFFTFVSSSFIFQLILHRTLTLISKLYDAFNVEPLGIRQFQISSFS